MDIEKNIFGYTSVWATILFEQFQISFGFKIEHGKTCPFPSKTGSSIPTFRDMWLQFLVWKNFYLQLLVLFLPDDLRYINSKTRWKHFGRKKNLQFFPSWKFFLINNFEFSLITQYVVQHVCPYRLLILSTWEWDR